MVRGGQLATSDPGDTPKDNPSLVVQPHQALAPSSIQLLGRNYRAFNLKMSHCAKLRDSDSFKWEKLQVNVLTSSEVTLHLIKQHNDNQRSHSHVWKAKR